LTEIVVEASSAPEELLLPSLPPELETIRGSA